MEANHAALYSIRNQSVHGTVLPDRIEVSSGDRGVSWLSSLADAGLYGLGIPGWRVAGVLLHEERSVGAHPECCVDEESERRIFNEMLQHEHPDGAVLSVGRQIRYLIGSEHGWLGGLHFVASALTLKPRDRWIGTGSAGRARRVSAS